MLAAGDTFAPRRSSSCRPGERNAIPVIAQATGADSASVIYDALEAATARKIDVLIADTAGRLHTKTNLMDELAKITRVMKKIDPDAPHEVMLVVDAGNGQNALNQAVEFHSAVGLTGITLTKLDGTAKGGIIFAIADRTSAYRSVSSASARASRTCGPSMPMSSSRRCSNRHGWRRRWSRPRKPTTLSR